MGGSANDLFKEILFSDLGTPSRDALVPFFTVVELTH